MSNALTPEQPPHAEAAATAAGKKFLLRNHKPTQDEVQLGENNRTTNRLTQSQLAMFSVANSHRNDCHILNTTSNTETFPTRRPPRVKYHCKADHHYCGYFDILKAFLATENCSKLKPEALAQF